MTQEEFIEMKNGYIKFVTDMMIESGGVGPSITVLGTTLEDQKNSIVHIPIPSKFMRNEDMKDQFVDDILPGIAKKVSEKFSVEAVVWASEAWLRVVDKKEELKDWKSIPVQKEVLIITIDSATKHEGTILEIVRKGKQVTEDGDLVDAINLVEMEDMTDAFDAGEGRFTGLYKKFTAS